VKGQGGKRVLQPHSGPNHRKPSVRRPLSPKRGLKNAKRPIFV